MSSHESGALLCRYRCRLLLAEIHKGLDRNSEQQQRLHPWESVQISDLISIVLGQQSSGPPRRTARGVQPQTDEQRREVSLCFDSPRIHQQSHEGIGRWRRAGLCGLPQELDFNPHPAQFGHRDSLHQRGVCAEAARVAWGGGRYKLARSATREQGRSKTGTASLPHVKMLPMSALGPTGERQERTRTSPSQGLARGAACSRVLTFSRSSGPHEICRKNAASCSTRSRCSCRKKKTRPRSSSTTTSGFARWQKRKE